jgi:hypothetical protein
MMESTEHGIFFRPAELTMLPSLTVVEERDEQQNETGNKKHFFALLASCFLVISRLENLYCENLRKVERNVAS